MKTWKNGLSDYSNWLIRLKYAFMAIGMSGILRIDRNAFRHLYDDGLTPIEAALLDVSEGGE